MENEFTIGQMAALHATTVKTLRYYDDVGLLKPARVDAHSGYRYYTLAQFERLNTIAYLRKLGLSIKAIKAHLDAPSIPQFLALLAERQRLVRQNILALQQVDRRLTARIAAIQEATFGDGKPFIQTLAARPILSIATPIRQTQDIELALRQLGNTDAAATIFSGGVGLLLDQAAMVNAQFSSYTALFVLAENGREALPAGAYACQKFNGDHTQAAPHYRQLLAWIAATGARVIGPAVEVTTIDQDISADPADYLTEIQIPIAR